MNDKYERYKAVLGNERSAMNIDFITQALANGSSAHVGNL